MKTLTRLRSLFHGFSDVGPEAKGFKMEMALLFLMICSLALFFYFSALEKREIEANIDQTEISQENNSYN